MACDQDTGLSAVRRYSEMPGSRARLMLILSQARLPARWELRLGRHLSQNTHGGTDSVANQIPRGGDG